MVRAREARSVHSRTYLCGAGATDLQDSIVLNIAEGAGEFAPAEKMRFYRMARRSAAECAALLDLAMDRELTHSALANEARETLGSVVRLLVTLIRAMLRRVEGGR